MPHCISCMLTWQSRIKIVDTVGKDLGSAQKSAETLQGKVDELKQSSAQVESKLAAEVSSNLQAWQCR